MLTEILRHYCDKGWQLFPLNPKTKIPAIKNNLERATNDVEKIDFWAKRFPGHNWAVSLAKSGLVAVDVDEKGLDTWEALVQHNKKPETLIQRSGSQVGLHFVFKSKPGQTYRGKISDGIDIKHNGYIAIYPSVHPKTSKEYKFLNNLEPADMPEWLERITIKPPLAAKKDLNCDINIGEGFYGNLITNLSEKEFGYDEWVKIGMALHSIFEGNDKGLDLFLALTSGVNFKEGDLEQAEYKWNGFRTSQTGVNGGTLIHIARSLGCEIPNPDFESDKELFAKTDEPKWLRRNESLFTSNRKFLISEINNLGYAMLAKPGGQIIRVFEDEYGLLNCIPLQTQKFHDILAPYSLMYADKAKPASKIWLASSTRQEYTEIVFRKETPPGALNLWREIPCKRRRGEVSQILGFIKDIICLGDELRFQYLIQWLAHLMQCPWEKCSVVPVLIGDEGTGKGLLTDGFLRAILKTYYYRIDNPDNITEKFNLEQSRKLLTVIDEISYQGNTKIINMLKSRTGNDSMVVEEKCGGRYTIDNPSRYIITSNDDEAIKIGITNRRYLTFKLSNKKLGQINFYDSLWRSIREDNLAECFYDYLLDVDISQFNPNLFPKKIDVEGENTKIASLGDIGTFWYETLFGETCGIVFGGKHLKKDNIFTRFQSYQKEIQGKVNGVSRQKFWSITKKMIPALDVSDTRYLNGNGTYYKTISVDPYTLAKSYCVQNNIRMPTDFNELDLLADTKDQNQEPNF